MEDHTYTSFWIKNGWSITHEMIEKLARQYWIERGCPLGSPELDWQIAQRVLLRSRDQAEMAFAHNAGGDW
jgi:DUF2934 family protein